MLVEESLEGFKRGQSPEEAMDVGYASMPINITVYDDNGRSKWVCKKADRKAFQEFVDDDLENPEDYHDFIKKHKNGSHVVLLCENVPCLAGDDVYVVYFPRSQRCASTFDGWMTVHSKLWETLEDALNDVLLKSPDDYE